MLEKARAFTGKLVGVSLFLGLWELIGRLEIFGSAFPPVTEIFGIFKITYVRELFLVSTTTTLHSAVIGFFFGALVAFLIAVVSRIAPILENGLQTFASILYAIPPIAFAPIFVLLAGPGQTPMLLAMLACYFPIYVAMSSSLRFQPQSYHDLPLSLGAGRARVTVFVGLPHAVPAFMDGLTLAAPAAILGAILGEWFGASRGLGVLIISALQNGQMLQLWGSSLLAVVCSFVAYALLAMGYRVAVNRFT